ncbi:response regulator [Magnetofaba australis]|uniref:Putative response regulator receiver protein n=1 Tax=Magnetofaba australis IT-1 TaxID=1434232 RepID=A0A1Y2K042_9PROT|nr:response regulator [Magnetofaba australis]OSM00164.1 putative response regulator receiver protein [Magnetofaba australis IT-1]
MAHILLIDDDARVRFTLETLLKRSGHTVTARADGKEGIDTLKKESFDLIITDIIMPNMDGVEFLMQFRSANKGDAPVIVISGGGRLHSIDYLSVAEDMGAAATLSKPFENAQLLDLVESLIGSKGAAKS